VTTTAVDVRRALPSLYSSQGMFRAHDLILARQGAPCVTPKIVSEWVESQFPFRDDMLGNGIAKDGFKCIEPGAGSNQQQCHCAEEEDDLATNGWAMRLLLV
jgi:hypothetical protein